MGVRQDGSCHIMPVKLRSCRGLRSHLRHAAPVRSSARRPALMAPVLAFGPRRAAAGFFVASPSSSLGFFLGPGRPRDFAVGSVCSFVLLLPGLGPGTPFRRGVSPAVAPVAGVERASASEPLSAEDGRTGGSSADEAGDELSLVLMLGVLFWLSLILGLANCWRVSPDSFRTTIKELDEFLAPARERPFGVAAGMVDD